MNAKSLTGQTAATPCWPRAIATERLTLTALTAADAAPLADILISEREHLAPFIEVLPRDRLLARIPSLAAAFDGGARHIYVVRDGGAIIGCVGVTRRSDDAPPELSYWLRAHATGQGFAVEATGALCDVALAYEDALEIRCHAANLASARVARRLGFVLVEELEEDGVALQRWIADGETLPAWRALKQACAAVAPVEIDDEGTLRVGQAALAVGTLDDVPYVLALSDIGPEHCLSGGECLAHNATLTVGALGLSDGRLQLRYVCPPSAITDATLRLFIDEASRLRDLTRTVSSGLPLPLSAYFTD